MPEKRYRFVPPGGGPNYDWTRDHTFVKVAAPIPAAPMR